MFYPEESSVPTERRTQDFTIRPLRTTDVELDYNAVIASRELLLSITKGRWPRDGFTMEDNMRDLVHHEKLHVEYKEFTFSIMNPS